MFDTIINYLNQERGVSFSLVSEGLYIGEISINGEKIRVSIDLGKGFPREFPIINIVDRDRFLPHVSSDGKLCLFDETSVLIKQNMPEQLLLDSYDRAIEILSMNPKMQKEEVFREFFAYWGNQSNSGLFLYTNLSNAEIHEFEEYIAIGSQANRLIVSNSIGESKQMLINHMASDSASVEKYRIPCYRIRLRASSLPKMNAELTWKNIRNYILNNITGGQKRKFTRMLSEKLTSINRLLLLVIPSIYGDQYACIWLHHSHQKRRVALSNYSDCKVDAVHTFRIDPKYMLARGGAEIDMMEKSVLLIGCGSVGGYIAENLCQCGIGTLDILDRDRLSIDNVHRHVLGFDDAVSEQYKADLLKMRLESRFPYVEIDSLSFIDRTAETFIKESSRLKDYDLIVSATGNPSLDLEINDVLFKMENAPPLIVCFNEPYGIGGHAIAVLKNGGCLRCLYSDPLSGELSTFQGSFVHDNQSFSKTISGCSSAFVEYSVLDSQQTAIMASRLMIDVLKGKCECSRLTSWLGSAEKLKTEGFQTSEYFDDLKQNGRTSIVRDILPTKRCQTCGDLL